jgi:hypothetical protein
MNPSVKVTPSSCAWAGAVDSWVLCVAGAGSVVPESEEQATRLAVSAREAMIVPVRKEMFINFSNRTDFSQ